MTDPHATDAERLREEVARIIEPQAMMTIEERRAAYAAIPPVVFGNRTQEQTESAIAYEYARAEYPRQQALSAADRILAIPAIARAVAAPVDGEAGEIVSLLTTRAHMDAYPVKTREQAAALITSLSARLAEAERVWEAQQVEMDAIRTILEEEVAGRAEAERKRDEAVAAEREECAQVAEAEIVLIQIPEGTGAWDLALMHVCAKHTSAAIARAIRARTAAPATTTEGGEDA